MAYLDIDTEKLRAGVTSAKRTKEAITEAVKLLNQIETHDDWICVERTKINKSMEENCKTAEDIQNASAAFYNAIDQASLKFDEEEQKSISRTNQLDEWLGQIISVVPGIAGAGAGSLAIASFDTIKNSLEG